MNLLRCLLIVSTFCCFPCVAQEVSDASIFHYRTVEDEDEYETEAMFPREFSFSYNLSEETKALVSHRVRAVADGGRLITLDDNSILEIGGWWKGRAMHWQSDEEVVLVLHSSFDLFRPRIEIINLTKQETVRAKFFNKRPNISNHCVVVKKIMPKGIIALNRDLLIRLDSEHFNELYQYWTNGDQLEIFLDPSVADGSYVRVWNVSIQSVLLNVKVIRNEEVDLILNQ